MAKQLYFREKHPVSSVYLSKLHIYIYIYIYIYILVHNYYEVHHMCKQLFLCDEEVNSSTSSFVISLPF